MKEMQALVVSKETTAGAKWINDHRASQGFEPLEVVVVGLIGADSQDASAAKLSSSALRKLKAQVPAAGAALAATGAGMVGAAVDGL